MTFSGKTVTVVDYGMGNLYSVSRAFQYLDAQVRITQQAEDIANAQYLVLPGVGAFENGMAELRIRGLIEPLRKYAANDKPMLGICLGMQMMLETSEEFGVHQGLGLLSGRVKAIPSMGGNGALHKIPHIGWNALTMPPARSNWQATILADVPCGAAVYFVHSFTAWPDLEQDRLADADYDGCRISAAIGRGNLWGCQFHPERSGRIGLSILSSFLAMGE
jgi:imidazole glycerol-phosphate synthase subunit HisH